MSPTKTAAPAVTYSTAGTVSSPLDLDNVKGEHQSVNVDAANGGSKRRVVSPKVKATLTSLTVNNVSLILSKALAWSYSRLYQQQPSWEDQSAGSMKLEFEPDFELIWFSPGH